MINMSSVAHPLQYPFEYAHWSVNALGCCISIPIARFSRKVECLSIALSLTKRFRDVFTIGF